MSDNDQSPDWDNLQGLWQDAPAIDPTRLFRKARFAWWRVRITLFLNLAICVIGELLCAFVLIKNISLASNVFGIVGLLFCWVTAWFTYKHLRSSLGDMSSEPEKLLELQIKQLNGLIAFARFNIKMTYYGMVFSAVAFWMFYEKHGVFFPTEQMSGMQTFVNGVMWGIPIGILLCPFIYGRFIKRKTQELLGLEASLAALRAAG
ncbi:hypothetical protein [Kordiimonas sp. SCSIO 12610]|uniref:hypothetical protein n=1 Tax=Kordiimonas sp. SCSIO 12610 TaxID=2829597 RepID=UPI002108AAB3|nr:hypothetical protein [Kordiimonas sp. SCSIO 12610]UTW56736.1 hypothetical protein KFF44_07565 [Kordiimonas sp. SCSIO 12610]